MTKRDTLEVMLLRALLPISLVLAACAGDSDVLSTHESTGGTQTSSEDVASDTSADVGATDDDGGTSTAGEGTAGEGTAGEGEQFLIECVRDEEPKYEPYTDEVPQVPICDAPEIRALPTQGLLVDLSTHVAGSTGTCGPFAADPLVAYGLPESTPLFVRLPALAGADPACASCSAQTAFGIALSIEKKPPDTRLLVRVPAPWFFVAANEHAPAACMDGGNILEYGKPLACSSSHGREFGFATADPNAPSVDAVIELVPNAEAGEPIECCPYTCP